MRRNEIDILKTIAIFAVVLYHTKILKYGYIGVDLFFLINGFLVIPAVVMDVNNGSFDYFRFMRKRIMRLLPPLLIITALLLAIGYYAMLPYDYSKLCEAIIATNFFSNNILALLTTGSYWSVSNDYKPLMHTWFVGVLFEFYILFPLITLAVKKISLKCNINYRFFILSITGLLMVLSLICYICFPMRRGEGYYLITHRFFEIAIGGIVGLLFYGHNMENHHKNVFLKVLCLIGMMSYSIYLWHQPILAFYRYSFSSEWTLLSTILFLMALCVLSYTTYILVERKIKPTKAWGIHVVVSFVIINGIAFAFYARAGVVRDVPELNIHMNEAKKGMHSEYVDRIFAYNHDFVNTKGKKNILVIGNSFARDWANILLESSIHNKVNILYKYQIDKSDIGNIKKADYIFIYGWKHNIPDYLWSNLGKNVKVYGIGIKGFGECNGRIYRKRYTKDYFRQTAEIQPEILKLNSLLKKEWGNKYINLLEMSMMRNNRVRVFTPENKFISPDTRHLSQSGAQFFANQIDFNELFCNNTDSIL